MGIGVERDAIGSQLGHLHQSPIKRLSRLARKSIDQVNVDRLKANLARLLDQLKDLLAGLHPVDRGLHILVEVLHTKTESIEPQLAQKHQTIIVNSSRIDLNRVLAVRQKFEISAD